ncbi:MAG: hypothetical protein ACOYOK_13290 [Pseudobdellovibrionaceae bacterium]
MKQQKLSSYKKDQALRSAKNHGGQLSKGKAKRKRPLAPNTWMHFVFKSSVAKGAFSLLNPRHRFAIQKLIQQQARQHFVIIKDGVNMGNHLHLQIKFKNPDLLRRFLRIITGRIAMLVTGARKGRSVTQILKRKAVRFWDELCYSRIVKSSFEVRQLSGYLQANRIERQQGYQARQKFLQNFNKKVSALKSAIKNELSDFVFGVTLTA